MGRPCRPGVVRDEEEGREGTEADDGWAGEGRPGVARWLYGGALALVGHGHCVTSFEIIYYERTLLLLLANVSTWLIHFIPFLIFTVR